MNPQKLLPYLLPLTLLALSGPVHAAQTKPAPAARHAPNPKEKTHAAAKAQKPPPHREAAVTPSPQPVPRKTPPPVRPEAPVAKATSQETPPPKLSDPLEAQLQQAAAEADAWRTYQNETARAWKSYQARLIPREAYDAQVRQARAVYDAVASGNPASGLMTGAKENALAEARTWLELAFCHSDRAQALSRQHRPSGGPTSEGGPIFETLLSRWVQTLAPEADQRRLEEELRDLEGDSVAQIKAHTERIQAQLGTRDPRRAYLGSWCYRS